VHEVARLEDEAERLAERGRFLEAIAALEEAHRRSGGATETRFALFTALAALRDEDAVRGMARALLGSKEMSAARKGKIEEVLADLDAEAGAFDRAGSAYSALVPGAVSQDVRRRLQVKARLCGWPDPRVAAPILRALAAEPAASGDDDELAALRIGELAAAGADPWLDYLAARQHFRLRDFAGALDWLDAAARHGLDGTTPEIARAARSIEGQALYRLGRWAEAREAFAALAVAAEAGTGAREQAEDWIARCDFAAGAGEGRSLDGAAVSH
jgi:hypothetical protein